MAVFKNDRAETLCTPNGPRRSTVKPKSQNQDSNSTNPEACNLNQKRPVRTSPSSWFRPPRRPRCFVGCRFRGLVSGVGMCRVSDLKIGRSTGNEASDAGLHAFCTVSVRDNASTRLSTKFTSRQQTGASQEVLSPRPKSQGQQKAGKNSMYCILNQKPLRRLSPNPAPPAPAANLIPNRYGPQQQRAPHPMHRDQNVSAKALNQKPRASRKPSTLNPNTSSGCLVCT